MMTLTLNPQTVQILIDIIESIVDELRVEIRHTDNVGYKDMLKRQRELLAALRVKLCESHCLISLDSQDVQTLIEIIENILDELRVEIRHTDSIGYKDKLKHQRQMLAALRVKLLGSQFQLMALAR